jgi:Tol biopolymer transport system component
MNIPTGQSLALTNATSDLRPLWSPVGTQIAFSRLTEKGYNIFVMDADDLNVRALTDTTENFMADGWTPDGQKVIGVSAQEGGNPVQLFDVASGPAQTLDFIRQSGDEDVSISPDGQWVAFTDKVPGRMAPGIFVSRLDGTEKRLLVQLESWTASQPLWSPDGNWLTFLVGDTDTLHPNGTSGLVNVKTCKVVPLPELNGGILGWVK